MWEGGRESCEVARREKRVLERAETEARTCVADAVDRAWIVVEVVGSGKRDWGRRRERVGLRIGRGEGRRVGQAW